MCGGVYLEVSACWRARRGSIGFRVGGRGICWEVSRVYVHGRRAEGVGSGSRSDVRGEGGFTVTDQTWVGVIYLVMSTWCRGVADDVIRMHVPAEE